MRRYYDTESPLVADVKALQRFVRARSRDECQAVQTVLEEFFTLEADGWHHKRCDSEIQRYRDKSQKARESVSKRWAKRDADALPTHTERTTDEIRNGYERNTDDIHRAPVPSNQTPDTSNQEKTKTARKRAAPAVLVSVDDMVAEGVERQHATDWLLNRKTKGLAPLTPTIWDETKREAVKAGLSVPDAIRSAAGEGWGGFKAKWLYSDGRNGTPVVDRFAGAE